jgi:hypothetical protein
VLLEEGGVVLEAGWAGRGRCWRRALSLHPHRRQLKENVSADPKLLLEVFIILGSIVGGSWSHGYHGQYLNTHKNTCII